MAMALTSFDLLARLPASHYNLPFMYRAVFDDATFQMPDVQHKRAVLEQMVAPHRAAVSELARTLKLPNSAEDENMWKRVVDDIWQIYTLTEEEEEGSGGTATSVALR